MRITTITFLLIIISKIVFAQKAFIKENIKSGSIIVHTNHPKYENFIEKAIEIAKNANYGSKALDEFLRTTKNTLTNKTIWWTVDEQNELKQHFASLKGKTSYTLAEKKLKAIEIIQYKLKYEIWEIAFRKNQKTFERLCSEIDSNNFFKKNQVHKIEPESKPNNKFAFLISTSHAITNLPGEIWEIVPHQSLNFLIKEELLKIGISFFANENFADKEFCFCEEMPLANDLTANYFKGGKNSGEYYIEKFEKDHGIEIATFGLENERHTILQSECHNANQVYHAVTMVTSKLNFPYCSINLLKTDVLKYMPIEFEKHIIIAALDDWAKEFSNSPTKQEWLDFETFCLENLDIAAQKRNVGMINEFAEMLGNSGAHGGTFQVGSSHEKDMLKQFSERGFLVFLFKND